MNLKTQRAAALKAAQDIVALAKAEDRDLTDVEQTEIEAKTAEIAELDEKIEKAQKSSALIGRLASVKTVDEEPAAQFDPMGGVGDAFVKSPAMQQFRKAHPSGVGSGTPLRIEVKELGHAADLGIGTKATLTTQTGQNGAVRQPGYRSEILDEGLSFLDLITTGSTDASYIEYAQIVSETDNAAIVAEGDLKPLSDVTTDLSEAKAFTYADGFDITNQTLADDGALAAYMEQRIRYHVRNVVVDKLLNGTGAGTQPQGILTTTGVQSQAFDTDVITTIARALGKVEAVQADPQAIVMNPADVWNLRLMKNGDQWALGNPLAQGVTPTPFGVPLVASTRVAAGTALVGNFKSVHFLEREPLSVVAFNQHKDYAQRNMVYVRAELRGLQLFYAPREVVVADLTAL
ncbi:phage major capsid protein [Nocardioides terrigena]|uniref:phage major capsid protein n=1 Tax=Nocardioides terrigena TaxID=424797 RepID=UPI00131ED1B4|nr:phage major capsid protein [Nocardioides terrigena]